MKKYMYVAVRDDLTNPQKAVQSCHAAIEAARYIEEGDEHPSVILLKVKDESGINKLENILLNHKINYKTFREPNNNNEKTALATKPVSEDNRFIFKKYQLLK